MRANAERIVLADEPWAGTADLDAVLERLFDWLAAQRNDLEAPALALTPVIGQALDAVAGADYALNGDDSGGGALSAAFHVNR